MRNRIKKAFVIIMLVATSLTGVTHAESNTRDYYREMADFAGFVTALHGAKNAHQAGQAGQADLEQLYLKRAEKVLDGMKMEPSSAQVLHGMGVGVIVNDVPEIPFLKEWESRKSVD